MSIQHVKEKARSAIAAAAGALLCIGLSASPAYAGLSAGQVFELDADATSGNHGGVDWQSFTAAGPGQTGIVADPVSGGGALVFIGGGSKDIYDTSSWNYSNKSTPPKDNIQNAYAVAGNNNGHLVVYAGLDRFSNNGTADAGFWFFQAPVAPLPGGGFGPGKHTEGDLLIVAEYTNGGSVGTLTIFIWHNGALVQQTNGADCTVTGGTLPCGRTNAGPIPMYWPPYTSTNPASKAGAGTFLEVGVDVTAIALAAGNPVPCFTSFLAESRSSATPSAVLKDFVASNFNVCGIKVGKSCPLPAVVNTDGASIHSIFQVPITNSGFGSLSNITLTDTKVDSSHLCTITSVGGNSANTSFPDATTAVPVVATLAGGATLNVVVECDSNGQALNSNPFYNAIKASGQTGTAAGSPTVTDSHTVTDDVQNGIHESCAAATNPSVTVTKICKAVNLVGGSNTPKVCVDIAIKSTTNELLTGLNLDDTTVDGTTLLNSLLGTVDPTYTLAPGATVTVPNVCYMPSRPDSSVAGTDVNPEAVTYSDKASVDATGAISGKTLSSASNGIRPNGGATCKLCPPPQGGP
jgi:hypothetical protein